MTTTAEACVEKYLQEQAAQQPIDKKTKKQRAALRKQVQEYAKLEAEQAEGRAKRDELRDELTPLLEAEVADGDGRWVSEEWLESALSKPPTKVKSIANECLVCEHKGPNPRALHLMRLISSDAWRLLHCKFSGGPELKESGCQVCVSANVSDQKQAAETADVQSELACALAQPAPAGGGGGSVAYHVPKTLGKRLAKLVADKFEDVTSELCCEHGNFKAAAESRLVDEATWRLVGKLFGASKPLVDGGNEARACDICAETRRRESESVKSEKAERQNKRTRLSRLLEDEMALSISNISTSPQLYVVDASWLQLWRESMRDKKATARFEKNGPINAQRVLCKCGNLRMRPELCTSWRRLEEAHAPNSHVASSGAESARDESLGAELCLLNEAEAKELADGNATAFENLPTVMYVPGKAGVLGSLAPGKITVCDQGCAEEALSVALADVTGFEEQPIYIHKVSQRPSAPAEKGNTTNAPLVDVAAADAVSAAAGGGNRRSRRSSVGAELSLKVSGRMSVNNLKLMIFGANDCAPSQQRLFYANEELSDNERSLADAGVVPKAKLTLWVDTSVEADVGAAMELLNQQTAEEKTGKPRKSEDGFLGSALLGSSFPAASVVAMEVEEEDLEEDALTVM